MIMDIVHVNLNLRWIVNLVRERTRGVARLPRVVSAALPPQSKRRQATQQQRKQLIDSLQDTF